MSSFESSRKLNEITLQQNCNDDHEITKVTKLFVLGRMIINFYFFTFIY